MQNLEVLSENDLFFLHASSPPAKRSLPAKLQAKAAHFLTIEIKNSGIPDEKA